MAQNARSFIKKMVDGAPLFAAIVAPLATVCPVHAPPTHFLTRCSAL